MSRILAVDYGDSRIGLAISDETKTIAQTLQPISVKNKKQVIKELQDLVKEKSVEKAILGLPFGLQGRDTAQTAKVKDFALNLAELVPVELVDERFTTRQAIKKLHEKNTPRSRMRGEVDSMSAYILLENYLGIRN